MGDWHGGVLIGFDLETTGTEPGASRIVTAALIDVRGGAVRERRGWLADPGIAIPEEASAIHGISTERAVREGRPAPEVADEVASALVEYWRQGGVVVAYNAAFDLTMLAAELARYGLPSLAERLGGPETGPVVDPLTIDRAVDRYRRGKRTLEAVCGVYGVTLEDAHDAGADALAAVQVARAIAARHPEVAVLAPAELHTRQGGWHARWARDFEAYLRRQGTPDAVIDTAWPLRALIPAQL
ncbi:3'-5' exonuclease [Streptomyces sp. G-G2]|uniref:3'-5' exonuclease n=1 Tax=Streptomyces sp. G-G2 TaxID=3046201 RepID=UPI0024BBCD68|nr:3'-5' exonuclease [Streptomyces sp. G-G2]MDJ0380281.1 3'-5' exonuclease [Streptomyces sp. G-G2]